MNPLEFPDLHFLSAAQGWLELGSSLSGNLNLPDATIELDQISPAGQKHPSVLFERWKIFDTMRASFNPKMVDMCLNLGMQMRAINPENARGHVIIAEAYYHLNQFADAYNTLAAVREDFSCWEIPYGMGCYACLLNQPEAISLIEEAIQKGKAAGMDIRTKALGNNDLKPLWSSIACLGLTAS